VSQEKRGKWEDLASTPPPVRFGLDSYSCLIYISGAVTEYLHASLIYPMALVYTKRGSIVYTNGGILYIQGEIIWLKNTFCIYMMMRSLMRWKRSLGW